VADLAAAGKAPKSGREKFRRIGRGAEVRSRRPAHAGTAAQATHVGIQTGLRPDLPRLVWVVYGFCWISCGFVCIRPDFARSRRRRGRRPSGRHHVKEGTREARGHARHGRCSGRGGVCAVGWKSILTLDLQKYTYPRLPKCTYPSFFPDGWPPVRLAGGWAGISRTPTGAGACVPGDDFGGRESIFSDPHTNEFVGMRKRAPEPTAACCGVNPCRRDYEEEEKKGEPQPSGCSGRTGGLTPAPAAAARLCSL
jgi:hypothetical protein